MEETKEKQQLNAACNAKLYKYAIKVLGTNSKTLTIPRD